MKKIINLCKVVFLALLIIFAIKNTSNNLGKRREVKNNGIYRRGYISERYGARGGVKLLYVFNYNNEIYKGEAVIARTDIYAGDSVYVKFIENEPDGTILFYKYPDEDIGDW